MKQQNKVDGWNIVKSRLVRLQEVTTVGES